MAVEKTAGVTVMKTVVVGGTGQVPWPDPLPGPLLGGEPVPVPEPEPVSGLDPGPDPVPDPVPGFDPLLGLPPPPELPGLQSEVELALAQSKKCSSICRKTQFIWNRRRVAVLTNYHTAEPRIVLRSQQPRGGPGGRQHACLFGRLLLKA
ncbi:hypothetical protein F4678DRAFT_177769 [Xylaria arbuscula]|nr:hypothetical protein F4678DRAFT_177769 [Xylaria arbuscula]